MEGFTLVLVSASLKKTRIWPRVLLGPTGMFNRTNRGWIKGVEVIGTSMPFSGIKTRTFTFYAFTFTPTLYCRDVGVEKNLFGQLVVVF